MNANKTNQPLISRICADKKRKVLLFIFLWFIRVHPRKSAADVFLQFPDYLILAITNFSFSLFF